MFFRNTQCVNCGSQLGFEPRRLTMVALIPGSAPDLWRVGGQPEGPVYRCCTNRQSASACNWLIEAAANDDCDDAASDDPRRGLCQACRLTRRMFDVTRPVNQERWRQLETAKRRLLAQLLALGLPVSERTDAGQGLAFDLLEAQPGGEPVLTGHHDGVITLNVVEADDAHREAIRAAMGEPYRTLLGHFRHEVGHYYWDRLVRDDAPRLAQFRALFGDERADYAKALEKHYRDGPPPGWALRYLSSYASTHPWEDWAETWAHYLHITDTVDTAASFGIDGAQAEAESEPFDEKHLWRAQLPAARPFLDLLNAWVQLTQVMKRAHAQHGPGRLLPLRAALPGGGQAAVHPRDRVGAAAAKPKTRSKYRCQYLYFFGIHLTSWQQL